MDRNYWNLPELSRVAEEFGTPAYVYDTRIVKSRVDAIRSAFGDMDIRLLYAMKANSLPDLLLLMNELGVGVDVVSPGELMLAQRLGFPSDRILFSANNMTDEEMDLAHTASVRLNIGELTRLDKFGRSYPGSSVSLRINPQHGAGHHEHVVTAGKKSKFGIPIEDLAEAREIATTYGLQIVGLHQHIGSGNLQLAPYEKTIPLLFDVARQFPELRFVNMGGGLGVAYRPDEADLDMRSLADLLSREKKRFEDETGRTLDVWMEPGRYLTAECGVLLVRVNTIKQSFGQVFVGTDSGMSHLIRPAIYGAYHGVVNVTNPDGPSKLYNVVGNICESSDFFAHDRAVSEIREGDVLAVLNAGAYGMAMASEYNLRPLPQEVLIRPEGTVTRVRKAERPEDLVNRVLAHRGS